MRLLFLNGQYRPDLSKTNALSDQIQIEYDDSYPQVLTVRILKNFSCGQPIYFSHINTESSKGQSQSLRCTITSEESTEVTIVDSYHGSDEFHYVNDIEFAIDIGSYARMYYYKWQNESKQASHCANIEVTQSQDSYFGSYHVVRGAQSSCDSFSYLLRGKRANCESLGFYQTAQQQQVTVNSCIHHLTSYTCSRQFYKGIANDQSHAIFSGKIIVDPEIQGIYADQTNNNLLLSEKSKIDTRPQLEIYSDDVRCSHGATVGQLDEESLFYLQSRGIDYESAKTLLISGFSNEVFQAFPSQSIANMIQNITSEPNHWNEDYLRVVS